ncbi:hypothetical protein BC826DRAFT_525090 [Russula brevipes]|nr:hypothetical protein BC826DRAFT_525090 [Russula brevipes]
MTGRARGLIAPLISILCCMIRDSVAYNGSSRSVSSKFNTGIQLITVKSPGYFTIQFLSMNRTALPLLSLRHQKYCIWYLPHLLATPVDDTLWPGTCFYSLSLDARTKVPITIFDFGFGTESESVPVCNSRRSAAPSLLDHCHVHGHDGGLTYSRLQTGLHAG